MRGVSLRAALVAALAYGAATVLQAVGVRRLAGLEPGARLRRRVVVMAPYAVGLALDAAGFVASVVALRRLPLFVVQSAIASSVAVTAILAVVVRGSRLRRREVLAVAALVLGLALLGSSAGEGPARALAPAFHWLVLAGVVPVAGLLALGLALPRPRPAAATVLAVAAGLGFGGVGVAARVLDAHVSWSVLSRSELWALLLYGAASLVAYGVALDRGGVTQVAAVTFSVETVVPAVVGLTLLGDRVRPGWVPAGAIGFALTLGACLVLAARAEPEPGTRP